MKRQTIILIVPIILLLAACSKNDLKPDMNAVVGTYNGSINYSLKDTSITATADITEASEYSVNVHCYATDFDTTFEMDLYQEGNTVYCNNGGYNDKSGHMDNMHQHCNTETHHGSFDMENSSFNYSFDNTTFL